jgi:hypothetical protein
MSGRANRSTSSATTMATTIGAAALRTADSTSSYVICSGIVLARLPARRDADAIGGPRDHVAGRRRIAGGAAARPDRRSRGMTRVESRHSTSLHTDSPHMAKRTGQIADGEEARILDYVRTHGPGARWSSRAKHPAISDPKLTARRDREPRVIARRTGRVSP